MFFTPVSLTNAKTTIVDCFGAIYAGHPAANCQSAEAGHVFLGAALQLAYAIDADADAMLLELGFVPPALERRSEPLRPRKLCQVSIEGPQGLMARLASDFQHQAIRKAKGGSGPEVRERARNYVCILQRQAFVIEQQLNRPGDLRRRAIVDGVEHPHGLGQDQVGDPRAGLDEVLGQRELRGMVAHQ